MVCAHCGSSNEDEARFCINCGGVLSRIQRARNLLRKKMGNTPSLLKRASFLRNLLDFSFHQGVSLRLIKCLYGLSILFAGLVALFLLIAAFHASLGLGKLVMVIGAPLVFFLIVIYTRAFLGAVLTISRMSDHSVHKGEQPESRENIEWNV